MKKETTPSSVKLLDTDLAFAIDFPRRTPQRVRCISLLQCLDDGNIEELLRLMKTAGKEGRSIDIMFDITEQDQIVGLELLR